MSLIYIIGPSSSGKDTLLKCLLNITNDGAPNRYCLHNRINLPQVKKLPVYTTRDPRKGETNGVEYFFIQPFEFYWKRSYDKLVKPRYFLETRTYDFINTQGLKTKVHYATGFPNNDVNTSIYAGVGTYESFQSIVKSNLIDDIYLVKLRVSYDEMIRRYFAREERTAEKEAEILRRIESDRERDKAYFDDSHEGIPDDHYIFIDNNFGSSDEFLHTAISVISHVVPLVL